MRVNTLPSKQELRTFGLLLPASVLFAGLGLGHLFHSGAVRRWAWAVGGLIALVYLALPVVRRRIFVGLSYLTYPIGWVVTQVLLTTIFLLVVTPIGLLLRLLGKDPLTRRFDPAAESYWVERPPETTTYRYFNQF
jgi:hypothetical protein